MLERFLVVQRDPQIMPIINEVVLGFSGHFHSTRRSALPDGTERKQAALRREIQVEKKNQKLKTIPNPVSRCSPSQRSVPALTPPSTAPQQLASLAAAAAAAAPLNPENARRPTDTASCGHRCVFLTFPVASVEVGLGPASGLWTLPPRTEAGRERGEGRGVIGGVRGSHLFPLEQRRTVAPLEEWLKLWCLPPFWFSSSAHKHRKQPE